MKKILLSFVFFLGACNAFGPQVRYLYNGPKGAVYEADCDGTDYTIGACYQIAAKTCNGDFEVMKSSDKNAKTYLYTDTTGVSVVPKQYVYTQKRTLIFYCNQ